MTGHDKDTPAERLADSLYPVLRWVRNGLPTAPRGASPEGASADGASPGGASPGTRRGCLHPLSLLKVVVGVAAVVLFPLFLLPVVLVRLVTTGRFTVKYTSVLDGASGELARWGYATLQPVPDAAVARSGTAAIAARDPGFDPGALTGWATAATGLICESLTSGDAAPARTFMSNGLFRAHQALLELRARGGVSFEGSWQPAGATLIQAVSTPLVDEVRVRVSCQGWRWERHLPSGLTLRGGPDSVTWSEDLTFSRSAGTVTPSAGGLPAKRCPSCGAQLALDADGACQYCRGIVTAGRDDWVLVSWRSDPW